MPPIGGAFDASPRDYDRKVEAVAFAASNSISREKFFEWLNAERSRVRVEALYEAQDALRGEDTRDWARRAHGSYISLPLAMKAIDDLIEEEA